jgi:hypothetical protein
MIGHYPPNCYPAHGWTALSARPMEWQVKDPRVTGSDQYVKITGTEYEFNMVDKGNSISQVVDDLLILPDGTFAENMEQVIRADADYLRRFYGAAQIQVMMDAGIPSDERREIFNELIGATLPMIEALRSGGRR